MLIHSAARPLRRRPASAGLFFGFFTQLCLELLGVAEAGVHIAVVGLLVEAADLVCGGPDVVRGSENLPEAGVLGLGGKFMQGKGDLHGDIVQSFSGLLPEVVEFQLSPLAGGEIEIGPLGQAVALLIPCKLRAGDPAGSHIGGVGMGVDTVGGEIVLQAAGFQAGLRFPVAEQAESSRVGDAGSAELVIDEKRVGHDVFLLVLFVAIFHNPRYTVYKDLQKVW